MPTLDETIDGIIRRLDENVVIVGGIRQDTNIARGRADQALADIVAARINVRGYTDIRIQEVYDYILATINTWRQGILDQVGGDIQDGLDDLRTDIDDGLGGWREWVDQNIADILSDAAALDQFAKDTWDIEIPRILAEIETVTEEIRQIEQDVDNQVGEALQETDEMASRWRQMADDIEEAKNRILEFDYSLYEVKNELHQQVGAEFDNRFANYDERITVAAGELGAVATKVETMEVSFEDQQASIQNLEIALIEGDEQLSQQIQSLSVGTNTQFDPFQIWHFDQNLEGWSGNWTNGYVRTGVSTTSPVLNVDASRYRQVRARIRRIGNPTWDATLSWTGAADGPNGTGPVSIQEPSWAGDATAANGEITVNPEWNGTLTGMVLTLGSSVDAANYWLLDWITVGRPAPGASSADITTERAARIAAMGAMASRIEVLEVDYNSLSGSISSSADAINGLISDIQEIDGQVTVLNNSMTLLEAAVNNPVTGLTATSSAIQSLTNRVETTEDGIEAVNSRIDNMDINVDDVINSSAFQGLIQRVSTAEGAISSTNTSVTSLNTSVSQFSGSISAAQAAANAANTLAGSKGRVFVQNAAPTGNDQDEKNLWIDTTGGANTPKRWISGEWQAVTDKVARDAADAAANALEGLGNKADSSAVTALTQRVAQAEGLLSSTSSNITSLTNSVTSVNLNVEAAQSAADAASALAGSKGKVIIQSGTPSLADRLPQNLWIDTTNNANTPKRWNGTSWAVVTDKAATDALAAANAATAGLANKADSSAVTALTSRVAQTESGLASVGQNITRLDNSIAVTDGRAIDAAQAAQAAANAAGAKGKVLFQSTAPVAADRLTQNLWIDTTGGNNTPKRWSGTAWVAVTDKVATDAAAAAALAQQGLATKANATAVTSLTNTVTQQGNTLSSVSGSVTALTNRINDSRTGLSALSTGINSLTSSVNSINGTLAAQAQSISGVEASVGRVSANGQLRMRVIASPSGVSSRIAIVANTSATDNSQSAGIFIDAATDGDNNVTVLANRFALVTSSSNGGRIVPFFVKNGAVYMNMGIIENGSIGNAKIGNVIQSDNFVAGAGGTGWRIRKTGDAEFNSVTIRRQIEVASGGIAIAAQGITENIKNGPAYRVYIPTNIPITAWGGTHETYLAVGGMEGATVSASDSATGNERWGYTATVAPLTKWSGTQVLGIIFEFWSMGCTSISAHTLRWKLYKVS